MKAKDYADQFNKNPSLEAIQSVGTAFLNEVKTTLIQRNAKTDSACLAVFKELDLKWQAFARMTNGIIKENGFRILTKEFYPLIYNYLRW